MQRKIFREWETIGPFLAVGFIGFCLNMVLLTVALWAGVKVQAAILLGIAASTLCNFMLDRHWVFSHTRKRSIVPQFVGFLLTCLLGAAANYSTALGVLLLFPSLLPQFAELAGILVGTSLNYVVLRFYIFI